MAENDMMLLKRKKFIHGTNDIALTAVTSKEDMYDDKGEGEETRAVLPSSHSWRAPTPIRWLPSLSFHSVRFYPHRTERASTCVRVRGRTRACSSLVRLRALVWGGGKDGGWREGDVRARVRMCVESRSRMCVLARGEQVYAFPAFLFPPFDSLWRFSRVSLFTGLSFSLSKR